MTVSTSHNKTMINSNANNNNHNNNNNNATTTINTTPGNNTNETSSNSTNNSNQKSISKLKLFSKFSFAKQSPTQNKHRKPTQSILSSSIKQQEKQQFIKPKSSLNTNIHPLNTTLSNNSNNSNTSLSNPESNSNSNSNSNVNSNSTTPTIIEPKQNIQPQSQSQSQQPLSAKSSNSQPQTPISRQPQLNLNSISNPSPLGKLLIDSDSSDDELDEQKLKCEENLKDYCPGGYHPTFIGENYGKNNEYLIVRKLGWGHFSTVWLAWDSINLRHVAIKIVRSSPNYSEAAIDEITILETINSKNNFHEGKKHIVKLLDHFIHKGPNGNHVCMIFEVLGENMLNLLIRYKDFQNFRQSEIDKIIQIGENEKRMSVHLSNIHDLHILSESYGGLPLTLVKQISKQILLALDYLHRECGIIHTDIKPENILVEIHDVEKLVQLLEFERKSKKLNKILDKRHNDHSFCLYHTNSYNIAQSSFSSSSINNNNNNNNNSNNTTNANPNPNNVTSSQRFSHNHTNHHNHNTFYSLSRSISAQNSISNTLTNTHSNNIINTPSRKNSIPIRPSKPLTSPVENSSVDNFFRSFSFSQKRNSSFSSATMHNNLGSQTMTNNNNNTSSGSNTNNNSPLLNNNINNGTFERHGSVISNNSQSKYTSNILLSPNFKRQQEIDIIDETDDEKDDYNDSNNLDKINEILTKPVKSSELLSSSSIDNLSDDNDIFVDATEPILSISPNISKEQINQNKISNHKNKSSSLASFETFQNSIDSIYNDNSKNIHSNNLDLPEKLVPFPSPTDKTSNSRKPSLSINTNTSICEDINPSIKENSNIEDLKTSESPRPSILNEFEEIISVKIADLGNSCWYNKHYTPDIQTRQYRAPEVILGGDWGCSTDIWSAACVIFELITSDYLFDPKSSISYSRNDDHLAQIVELLQTWPSKDYLKSCSRWREFFDRSGQNFKKIGKLKIWPLKMVLIDEYKMTEDLATEVSDFLLPMLEFVPGKRVDAGSMCSHPWIKDINCGGADLGRKFGLRGDGIKGWSEEYHS
ncbi:serine/threonine protein kinase, CMGC group [Pichia californica]|uniref:non-specific serine/threonine protein kinase n=1 Tax=Pichia californica TaxID=460514 RepID=A0A9P7BGK2_9ASCO|nr:serine/threonine protein kinase, CMGC group [[Candida] californica]